jgi:hypothetical protein
MGFWPPQTSGSGRARGRHAAPTELGGSRGIYGYKRGAPNGAFRITAATPPLMTGWQSYRRKPSMQRQVLLYGRESMEYNKHCAK